MKFSTIGLGLAMVIGSLLFLKPKWSIYQIERNGQVVGMKIVKLPGYCGLTRGKYYMDVAYEGLIFNKRIPTGFCDKHQIGQSIEMKYLEGHESILFPKEKIKGDFIVIGIFFGIGLIVIIYGIFERRKRF